MALLARGARSVSRHGAKGAVRAAQRSPRTAGRWGGMSALCEACGHIEQTDATRQKMSRVRSAEETMAVHGGLLEWRFAYAFQTLMGHPLCKRITPASRDGARIVNGTGSCMGARENRERAALRMEVFVDELHFPEQGG